MWSLAGQRMPAEVGGEMIAVVVCVISGSSEPCSPCPVLTYSPSLKFLFKEYLLRKEGILMGPLEPPFYI